MRTIKLALTAVGLCALVGASTNAHARFNSNPNGGRSSFVGAVQERFGSSSTRGSSTQKLAAKNTQSSHDAETKAPGPLANAKGKLASLSKRVSSGLGPKGTPRGAGSGISDKLFGLGTTGMLLGLVGLIPAGALSMAINNPIPAYAAMGSMVGGFASLIASCVTDTDYWNE